jgi:hypothetical protein
MIRCGLFLSLNGFEDFQVSLNNSKPRGSLHFVFLSKFSRSAISFLIVYIILVRLYYTANQTLSRTVIIRFCISRISFHFVSLFGNRFQFLDVLIERKQVSVEFPQADVHSKFGMSRNSVSFPGLTEILFNSN